MRIKLTSKTVLKNQRAQAIRLAAKRFAGSKVSIGVHEDAGTYEAEPGASPVPVSKVAFWLENGTQYMPARPFFYPTLEAKQGALAKLKADVLAKVAFAGESVEHGLARLGFAVQVWLQNTIKSNVSPALTPNYLRSRRLRFPESGSRTLIASGLLLRSVRYKVTVAGGEAVQGPANAPEADSPAASRAQRRAAVKDARAQKAAARKQRREAQASPDALARALNAQRRASDAAARGGRR